MYLFVCGISKYCGMNPQEEYKNNLLKFDLQSFLNDFDGFTSLRLKKLFPDLYKLLASQLAIYPKAKSKLPYFTSMYCYLTSKAYEQSSSEAASNYKASLFTGNILIDLSAGLGIDDIAFSERFNKVFSVDNDSELNLIAEVNFQKLGITNIKRITAKSEDYIKTCDSCDMIYIDADRRMTRTGKKAITLHDSSPDIPAMLPKLMDIAGKILLKLSPLVDITYLKKALPHIKDIRVLSVDNEVKEILVLIDNSCNNEAEIIAVDISANGTIKQFSSNSPVKNNASSLGEEKFFFEPSPALIKAGLVKQNADLSGLKPIGEGNVYHTTDKLLAEPFGRMFTIINQMTFSKSTFRKYLSDNSITKANISCRSFPVKPDEIKKQFSITDGGDEYFFFTTGESKTKRFYHCRKTLQKN